MSNLFDKEWLSIELTENRKQKTENRKQKTENRKPKTVNRKQSTASLTILAPLFNKKVNAYSRDAIPSFLGMTIDVGKQKTENRIKKK